jgi:DegV family protein with EDD domain
MAVAIVTDGAASLPAPLAAEADIVVVPMWLDLGGRQLREDECSLDEVLHADVVTTSGPSPGEFASAIESVLTDDGALVLTIAASMSSTHQAAVLAADSLGERDLVRVVDTNTAAGAEGLVALAAAQAAQDGADLDTAELTAKRVSEQVRLVATVPSLDHLVRSGRVPGIAGWAGRHLGINPLFEFRSGDVRRLRPALSPEAATDRIMAEWRHSRRPGSSLHLAALHAMAGDAAHDLLTRVAAECPPATSFEGEFSAVMVAHVGPGLVGLAWWWDDEARDGR